MLFEVQPHYVHIGPPDDRNPVGVYWAGLVATCPCLLAVDGQRHFFRQLEGGMAPRQEQRQVRHIPPMFAPKSERY
jgi:hypothetical protein